MFEKNSENMIYNLIGIIDVNIFLFMFIQKYNITVLLRTEVCYFLC